MEKVNMDFLTNGKAFGTVAQKLLQNGMNVNALRPYFAEDGRAYITVNGKPVMVANATLRYDEWKHYDTAVLKAATARLTGVADLISRGLVYTIPNGMASTVLQYEDASSALEAQMSMDGLVRGKSDKTEYDINYLPLPITHADFQINARVLAASRQGGSPMDTTLAEQAGMRVAEKLEDVLFKGSGTYTFGGGTIYGYEDHPDIETGSLSHPWNGSGATGATIVADIMAMKNELIANKRYGPYIIYVPTDYETVLDEDYVANYPKTIRQRILEIGAIQDVKVSDRHTQTKVIMVEMNATTVRMVNGMGFTPVEWQEQGGLVTNYKVMTLQVPQIRSDQDNNCGVCVYSE